MTYSTLIKESTSPSQYFAYNYVNQPCFISSSSHYPLENYPSSRVYYDRILFCSLLEHNPCWSHSKYHLEQENFTPTRGIENYCMLLRNLSWNKHVLGVDSLHFVKKVLTKSLNYYINSLLNFISLNLKENYETFILVRLYMKKLDPLFKFRFVETTLAFSFTSRGMKYFMLSVKQ